MLIALDYDDTYTRDPIMWDAVVRLMQERGHTVIGVTARYTNERASMRDSFFDAADSVVFSNRGSKRYATKLRGYLIDVWIDDLPDTVDGSSKNLTESEPRLWAPEGRMLK